MTFSFFTFVLGIIVMIILQVLVNYSIDFSPYIILIGLGLVFSGIVGIIADNSSKK